MPNALTITSIRLDPAGPHPPSRPDHLPDIPLLIIRIHQSHQSRDKPLRPLLNRDIIIGRVLRRFGRYRGQQRLVQFGGVVSVCRLGRDEGIQCNL